MEISTDAFNKICFLIESAKKDINYELEARFLNKNNRKINLENYNKIFQKLTFSKENNGFGYNYDMINTLDIILDKVSYDDVDTIRISINGTDNIKKYWLSSNIDNLDVKFIEKEKIDKLDEENYNIRFSLNNEIPQNNILNKNKDLLLSTTQDKVFRLKNRYSIKTDDNLFLIDMTSVKLGHGNSFKESNTLKENMNYEIEIEYIGKKNDLDTKFIAKKFLYHCEIILKILQNTNILLTNTLANSVKNFYNKLVNNKLFNNKYIDNFIAASPVTIHRDYLLKNSNTKNVYNRYAVTLKADGERNFLIVYTSNNEEDNGKIFIFNNNFNFIYTGYKDKEWCGTLIEAEFINNNIERELYMYDILFSKGNDVRRKHLTDIKKDTIANTRLNILDNFQKSTSRIMDLNFNENNCIKLKTKKYIQSVRNDGTDIFQKVKELWDNRKYSTFNVDGIIFVPKYEYYPMNGGSWNSLFKWKPEELNTIDFLIKVAKDDNNKDIKNPYIEVIDRIDGKNETILKQYKNIKLYVTGQKTIYTENYKMTKKNIPIPFNPFNMDEKNSEIYNLIKVIIDDDEKIYANDPITGEKEEIFDDIIVEFGYDNSREDGFKWIPYRFRKDKTSLYKNGKEIYGNSQFTANDIFKAINLPVTEAMITTGNIPLDELKGNTDKKSYYLRDLNNNSKRERFQYQNFHNHYIKYQLLYFSSPSYIFEYKSGVHGKLLDLCCGKGVDINKIKKAKYAEVVGMDIDYKNIKEAQEFYKNMVPFPKPKAFYFRGDSSKLIWPIQACGDTEAEKIKAKEYIPSKYLFDTISLQFCFHYFFKDEISLRTVIQNMNDNLKIGGFVIGTTFDGERLYEKLKNTEFISGKTSSGEIMWKVEKKFSGKKLSFTDKKPNFGKQIDVFVKTIGNVHPEYLVNFNYFDKIMEEYGFSKIVIKPFEEFYNELIEGKNLMDLTDKELEKDIEVVKKMSEDEKRFSFMSSGFIYKKEKNSSDMLVKKLVDLMEKKDKLRKKEGVYKVDENTEHIIEETELYNIV
jgi:hypothetical protein